MKYNFDEVIDRSHNRAAKYDERMKKFGREDVIPLWVADMDFRTAEPTSSASGWRAGCWPPHNRHAKSAASAGCP